MHGVQPCRGPPLHRLLGPDGEGVARLRRPLRRLLRRPRGPDQRHRRQPRRRLRLHLLLRRLRQAVAARVRTELAHPHHDAKVPAVAGERAGAEPVAAVVVLPLLRLFRWVHQFLGEGEDVGEIQPWRILAGASIRSSMLGGDREADFQWIGRYDD